MLFRIRVWVCRSEMKEMTQKSRGKLVWNFLWIMVYFYKHQANISQGGVGILA